MKNKNLFFLLLLILISIIPLLDLFHPGLPITHDGQDHVARIANFYQNLKEGNIVPRWAANLNWGYGHPILMFLYPMSSYLASLFHFLGFSLVDSTKIVFGLSFILSGTFMYLWLSEFLDEKSAFIGGILYMFAPYRFVDLYVRGAIGEHVAFTFLPLILYFIIKINKKNQLKDFIGGSFSVAFLVLSHNAISLLFLPLVFLYTIYLNWFTNSKKDFFVKALLLISFGIGLSAFFWIPGFFEGKYTLRDIVTKGGYLNHFVEFKNFFYSPWSYGISGQFTPQIGIVQWILVLFSVPLVVVFSRRRNKLSIILIFSLVLFLMSLFMMIQSSQFLWEKVTIIQKFQFPWRVLSLSIFLTAVIGSLCIHIIPQKMKILIMFILFFFVLFFNKDYWHAKNYLYKNESFYADIYDSTTDTGESAPIWSVRFMEKRPKSKIEIIEGEGKIKEARRTSTIHDYKAIINTSSARIRENTLYFPGWFVYVDGNPTDIQFQDPQNRGLITFYVNNGEHNIEIKFRETKFRTISDIISLGSFVLLILFSPIIYNILNKKD